MTNQAVPRHCKLSLGTGEECHHCKNDQIRLAREDIRCSFAWSGGIVSCVSVDESIPLRCTADTWPAYVQDSPTATTGCWWWRFPPSTAWSLSLQGQNAASTKDLRAPWTFSSIKVLFSYPSLLYMYSTGACVCAHLYLFIYMCRHVEARDQPWVSSSGTPYTSFVTGLLLAWSSYIVRLAISENQGFSCLCLPSSQITSKYLTPGIFIWILRMEFRLLGLQGKSFIQSALCSHPTYLG